MSARLMGEVFTLRLPHNQRELLLALADHANDEGKNVFPGVPRLAWKIGYSERQVQRILRSLEEKKILRPVRNKRGGNGRATEYEINLGAGEKKAAYESAFKRRQMGDTHAAMIDCDNSDTPSLKSDPQNVQDDVSNATDDIPMVKGDFSIVQGDAVMSAQPLVETSSNTSEEASTKTANEASVRGADAPTSQINVLQYKKLNDSRDSRTSHPAIQAIKTITDKYPHKELYDDVISALSDQPNLEKLRECRKEWLTRGHNPNAITWALEWYSTGVPTQERSNKSKRFETNNRPPTVPERDSYQLRTMRRIKL